MEKYEIKKYFDSFETKINDLYIALSIEKNTPILLNLEQEIEKIDFWNDQKRAQKIISQANILREKIENFNDIKKGFNDLEELLDLADIDDDASIMLEEEILNFDKKITLLEEESLLSGKHDMCEAIVELHPGAGGTESMDWCDMLYRMYIRYCQMKNFKVTVLDYQPGDEAGIKSVTFLVKGRFAYGLLRSERGVHRLVRISPFDSNARRHTSFVSCDVAPQIEEADDVVINDEDIKIDVYRSSGAGGQSVNTTDSAVRITHKPTGVVVTCQNERSQIKNREVAMKVLKSKLLELELKKQEEELNNIKGEQMGINFGSQIRSYVFCPYTLVKDHRTNCEVGNINGVMDGDIEPFIHAYLRQEAGNK